MSQPGIRGGLLAKEIASGRIVTVAVDGMADVLIGLASENHPVATIALAADDQEMLTLTAGGAPGAHFADGHRLGPGAPGPPVFGLPGPGGTTSPGPR